MRHTLKIYEVIYKNGGICNVSALSIKDVFKLEKEMFGDIEDIKSVRRLKGECINERN